MKTKIILLILSIVFAIQSQAQIETKVFTLNLGEPTLNSLRDSVNSNSKLVIKAKEPLAFKLVNGNPYKYKYVINHDLITFFDFNENPLENVKSTLEKIEPKEKSETDSPIVAQNKINTLSDQLSKLNFEISDFKASNMLLSTTNSNKINLEYKSKLKQMNLNKIELEKAIEIANLELQAATSEYNFKSQYSIAFVNQHSKQAIKVIPKNQLEDEENITLAINLLGKEFKNLKSKLDKYILIISAEDYLDKLKFEIERESYFSTYTKLISDTKDIGSEAYLFENTKKEFDENIKEIDPLSVKIIDEISKMMQLKFDNYIVPIDINGKNIDAVEVTVERYDKTATNPTPDKYTYNIWVKGGVKIDISGGLFLTSLMDKEYETKDDGSNKYIFEKNRGDYEFGFGSTINVSLRGGSWVRPGLSIGALFTTNQKFQLLTGLGFIIGKEERIVLHTGLSMGRISRISDNYKTDGSVSYDLGTEGTIPMTEKFAFGHFFGLTYNFGKVKKQDEKN
ncbi:hypothetical protein [Flavobacterium sp. UBA6195]|uniref:hypothetical protein n=1 Tax=Flavobacterium sp. UBA6195 TaxID=1946554 RepID=UPI0025C10E24|nr:hypothetical protein [Flavobacterium sp. UBA6195]